jgi:hypothetical protein
MFGVIGAVPQARKPPRHGLTARLPCRQRLRRASSATHFLGRNLVAASQSQSALACRRLPPHWCDSNAVRGLGRRSVLTTDVNIYARQSTPFCQSRQELSRLSQSSFPAQKSVERRQQHHHLVLDGHVLLFLLFHLRPSSRAIEGTRLFQSAAAI